MANDNTALRYDRTAANGGQAGDAARVASHPSCGNLGKTRIIGNIMTAYFTRPTSLFFFTLLLCLPHLSRAASHERDVQCVDVVNRGVFNVLTINILFSDIETRNTRLDRIAQFVKSQFEAANPVDVILLQEAAGGILVKTENSAEDFTNILNTHYGLNYSLRMAYSNGVPGLLAVFNATLSRCEVTTSLWTLLPPATEIEFQGYTIPLTRSVLMTRLEVPGVGTIEVYNTHLCANCRSSERLEQAQRLLRFLHNVETLFPGQNPMVLGGDFNTNLAHADQEEAALYQFITADSQFPFQDSYAVANSVGNPSSPVSCIRRDDGGIEFPEGCTVDVSEIRDPLRGALEPARIDYIFVNGVRGIVQSRVVFTPFNPTASERVSVSDHSAVLTSIRLP
jgi:maltose 6'-phosphate phosphatase